MGWHGDDVEWGWCSTAILMVWHGVGVTVMVMAILWHWDGDTVMVWHGVGVTQSCWWSYCSTGMVIWW